MSLGAGVLVSFILSIDESLAPTIAVAAPLILAGLAVFLMSKRAERRRWLNTFESDQHRSFRRQGYHARWLRSAEIPLVVDLAHRRGLDSHGYPDPEKLAERLERNARVAYGVFDGAGNLRACVILYPLSGAAVDRFQDGTWVNARAVQPRDLTSGWHSSKGIYIALVLADFDEGELAKGPLRRFVESAPDQPVYSRAATERGESLLEKYGFRRMRSYTEDDKIYCLSSEI